MQKLPTRGKARTPYWLKFSLVMLGFGAFTSAFVLIVLPKRYILQSGLVESGVTFPTRRLPFEPAAVQPAAHRTQYAARQEAPEGRGPAERFWADVLPLLDAGHHERALPLFAEYLARFPDDLNVWREYMVALVRTHRENEAADGYRRLAGSGDSSAKLALARLLRDLGDIDESIAVYREILYGNPDDVELRHEMARTLVWAERYEDAAPEYRELIRRAPGIPVYRLELAQLLYWDGRPEEAFHSLAGCPVHADRAQDAIDLLAELTPLVAPPVPTAYESIRRAIDGGDLTSASRLFERVLARSPRGSDLWLEWVDFLQYRLEDLEAARGALMHRSATVGLTPAQRLRLARLHLWTGHDDQAKSELLSLVAADATNPGAWVLLGNLYRWEGARTRAMRAYRQALFLSADIEEALAGIREIHADVERAIARRDRSGIEPLATFFRDSDDFRRFDVGLRAATRRYGTGVAMQAGYRRLGGFGPAGTTEEEQGPFVELELVRWWRLGAVRTSVAAGLERLDAFGAEPAFGARIEIPDVGGTALQILYDHAPAYRQTVTLESVRGEVHSDNAQVGAYRRFGERWSVAATAALSSLRGSGADNWRLSAAASATGTLAGVLSAGVSSRFLSYSTAAPVVQDRRMYWDPSLFWSHSLVLEARTSDATRWTAFGRLTPGVALARERTTIGSRIVPQFGTEAGVRYETERTLFVAGLAYLRGRAGGYNSLAGDVRLSIRP